MKHTLKTTLLVFTCCVLAASCEQKNTERETQLLQHHDDSLRAAIEAEANGNLQRQNDSLKNALSANTVPHDVNTAAKPVNSTNAVSNASELVDDKLQLTRLNTLLVNVKAKLEYEKNELTRAEQFHVGRTRTERETQIRQQSIRVQTYQNLVQKTQQAIITLNTKINELQNGGISQTN